MTSKSLAAFAFICLAPVAAFAQTAPATAPAPVAKAPVAAVTAPAPAVTTATPAVTTPAPAAKVAAPAATVTAPAGPTTAAAPNGDGSKRWQTCAADVQKFCGTVEKGKGAIRTCLEGHAAELTPACKTSLADHAAAHAAKGAEKAGEKAADKTVKQ